MKYIARELERKFEQMNQFFKVRCQSLADMITQDSERSL